MKTGYFMLCAFRIVVFSTILLISEPKRIVCYVGTDSGTRLGRGAFHINDVKAEFCTHVIFGFPRIENEHSVKLLASWTEFMKGTNMTAVKLKYPHVTFMVALGGWYNGAQIFYRVAKNDERRRAFVETSLDLVKSNDFDGLELCWLYPTKRGGFLNDRLLFVDLLKAFKDKFKENNLIFTALLGGSYTTIDAGYDVKEIFKIVDFVNVISYDYNGVWSDKIAPNAPLYSDDKNNVNHTVQHFITLGADREKITIGITFYGRVLFATPGSQYPTLGDLLDKNKERIRTFMGPYTRDESGDIAYNEICLELLKPGKWEEHWDNKSQTPYLVTSDKLITYENITSVNKKVKYAFDEQLGGVMIFSLDQDDFRGDCLKPSQNSGIYKNCPMLRNLYKTFNMYFKNFENNESHTEHTSNHKTYLEISNVIYLFSLFLIIYTN